MLIKKYTLHIFLLTLLLNVGEDSRINNIHYERVKLLLTCYLYVNLHLH